MSVQAVTDSWICEREVTPVATLQNDLREGVEKTQPEKMKKSDGEAEKPIVYEGVQENP